MHLRTILTTLTFCLAGVFSASAQLPTSAIVKLQSGRQFEGLIDAQSTDHNLVLRFERGSAVLWRSIHWSEIRAALLDGKSLTPAELSESYQSLATPAKSKGDRVKLNPEPTSPSDRRTNGIQPEEKPLLPAPRIISVAFDALLANWDGDVEADGLVLHLQPLAADQQLTAASGTLEVELYALQARAFHHASHSRGRSVEPIGRWTQAVNPSDYSTRGAVIQFPFQAAHPEFDDSVGAYGLVHLKFSVPGSGVFERSIDGVRIRPWAPLRDYLQMDTGRRFLPHEGTGRGKTSWFTDDQ